ncbi:MAG TPA: 3-oxoacyl-[acyl-carrier-protein] reductase [Firmicutes bacterium]|nr:3-oxoacyl-[acyl-carrier-protein] reductase [Bacillota bacterium]
MLLKGRVAVVTGGSRGIGRAIVLGLAAEGAQVVISYGHNDEAARETLAAVKAMGGDGLTVKGDVRKPEDCKSLADLTLANFNRIDILVNNAGITRDNILARMKETEWEDVIETNLTGAFNCTQAFIKPFLKQKAGGRIINMASVVGLAGAAGQTNYAAAKAGLVGFTKALARELAGRGITVNAVAPGFVRTGMTGRLSEKQKESILAQIPLGRVAMPEEIAAVVTFLATKGGYITGEVININGGLYI